MFEFITDEKRGQVGIGTLIVFIAMVLVAAIAAGVLINTAGFLQSQAEATGEESTDLVSERIEVVSSTGIVDDAEVGNLSEIRLTVSGAPGSDDIDLADSTIQAVGPGGQENLVFASEARGDLDELGDDDVEIIGPISENDEEFTVEVGVDSADDLTVELDDGSTADDTTLTDVEDGDVFTFSPADFSNVDEFENGFTVSAEFDSSTEEDEVTIGEDITENIDDLSANEFAVGQNGTFEDSAVLDSEEQFTILLNPDAGALEDGAAFGEGDDATLDIVSPAGATTSVELTAPDLFSEEGEAVRL